MVCFITGTSGLKVSSTVQIIKQIGTLLTFKFNQANRAYWARKFNIFMRVTVLVAKSRQTLLFFIRNIGYITSNTYTYSIRIIPSVY